MSARGSRPPAQVPPGPVDVWLLVVALVVCVPAGFRLAQGMLSLTDLLTRYLLVALGCVALAAAVRWVWPILSGELPRTEAAVRPSAPEPAAPPKPDRVEEEPATSLLASLDDDPLDLSPATEGLV